jgi:V/A-type H+/Na+-transporting ATPase subunit D
MARYQIAPTKTNLFKIKRNLEFAKEGHQLLEQKRQILITELMSLVDKTKHMQESVEKELEKAFYALEQAVIRMGRGNVSNAAMAVNIENTVSLSRRGIMGVDVPVIKTIYKESPPYYGLDGTSFWLDESIERFKSVLNIAGKLVEMKVSLLRLAREAKKTIRKVNALEKIALPDYRQTVKYIQDVLEEQERQAFFVLKLVRERLGEKN